tara:strand:- start:831 stop:1847 length:1017 start_codon:yes stop_codon:yes gene_type:complete
MITGRFFRLVGVIVLIVAAIATLVIVFLPSTAYMERSLHIKAPPEIIYQELISFRNFKNRSPWAINNPNAIYTIYGPETGVGAGIRWENGNEDFQSGSIEIIDVLKNQYVVNKMEFSGYGSNPQSKWMLHATDSGTLVTWAYDEKEIKGFNKVFMLGIDGFLGGIYEQGLNLLKERVESLPESVHQLCIVELNSQHYLGIEDISINDRNILSDRMRTNFEELFEFIKERDIQVTGPPFTIYTSFSEKEIEFINGIPISTFVNIDHDQISLGETYRGRAVNGSFSGDYELLMGVFRDIESFIFYYNYERFGNIWEEYHEGFLENPDSIQWEAQVYYPIK